MNSEEVEKILRTIRSWWWLFLIYAILALPVLLFLFLNNPPSYVSQTKIFVTEGRSFSLADMRNAPFADRAIKTVTLLTSSQTVLDMISNATGIPVAEVAKSYHVENLLGTQLIEIRVSSDTPEKTALLIKAIPMAASKHLSEIQASVEPEYQIITSVAESPSPPAKDDSGKLIVSGLALLIFTAGAYLIAIYLSKTRELINEESDLENTGVNFLGYFGYVNNIDVEFMRVIKDKNTAVRKALNDIFVNMIYQKDYSKVHTIVISSPKAAAGKTSFAIAFTEVLASAGKKVAIIEASPTDTVNKDYAGLSDYAEGNASPEDIVHKAHTEGVYIITRGKNSDFFLPAFFNNDHYEQFKQWLLEKMGIDYLLIDSPSVLADSGASVIMKSAELGILVVENNKTTKSELVEARNQLAGSGFTFLGAVISKKRLTDQTD